MLSIIHLRRTLQTLATKHADAFPLKYVAGHDTMKAAVRCVPPHAHAAQAFAARGSGKNEYTGNGPQQRIQSIN